MTDRLPANCKIRRAQRTDLAGLVRLCLAHAAYERVSLVEDGQAARLERALFESPPRLHCLVVECAGVLVGYATCSREYSTWRAEEYVHLDCLYLEPAYRGRGLGRALMTRVGELRAALGATRLEWQTPAWNTPAIGFYERLGARAAEKIRFSMESA